MNLKKIIILHYCYSNKDLCFFQERLEYLMKDYPDDAIIENNIIKYDVNPNIDCDKYAKKNKK